MSLPFHSMSPGAFCSDPALLFLSVLRERVRSMHSFAVRRGVKFRVDFGRRHVRLARFAPYHGKSPDRHWWKTLGPACPARLRTDEGTSPVGGPQGLQRLEVEEGAHDHRGVVLREEVGLTPQDSAAKDSKAPRNPPPLGDLTGPLHQVREPLRAIAGNGCRKRRGKEFNSVGESWFRICENDTR